MLFLGFFLCVISFSSLSSSSGIVTGDDEDNDDTDDDEDEDDTEDDDDGLVLEVTEIPIRVDGVVIACWMIFFCASIILFSRAVSLFFIFSEALSNSSVSRIQSTSSWFSLSYVSFTPDLYGADLSRCFCS